MDTPTTWMITGSSSGFGREIATAALARGGDRVSATARRPDALSELRDRHPGRCVTPTLDVTDRAACDAAVAATLDAFGRIDVLVNNAGYGLMGAVEDLSEEQIRRQIEVNVFGVLNVTRAALPAIRRSGGRIVMLSSVAGRVGGTPGFGVYSLTKHAVIGLGEVLAKELASSGVRVVHIEPGAFKTDFNTRSLERAEPSEPYREVMAKTADFVENGFAANGGDPAGAAAAIVDAATAEDPPLHLPLGSESVDAIRGHEAELSASLDEWEDRARAADHAPA